MPASRAQRFLIGLGVAVAAVLPGQLSATSLSLPVRDWVLLHDGSGADRLRAPAMRVFSPVTWDSYNRVVVYHGGSHDDQSAIDTGVNSTSLWAFDPLPRTWARWWYDGRVVAPLVGGTGIPRRRHAYGLFAYLPDRRTILLYGGISHPGTEGSQGDTWEFDVVTKGWLQRSPSKRPGPRLETGMVYDVCAKQAVVYGGLDARSQETWSYDPVAVNWTLRTSSSRPTAVVHAALTYDSRRSRIVLFGGSPDYEKAGSNDLWSFDLGSNRWTRVDVPGVKPPGRVRHGLAYDSVNDVFLTYGGYSSGTSRTDTWIYDPRANGWTQVLTPTTPNSDRVEWRLTYSPEYNVFLMVIPGGAVYPGDQVAKTWGFRYSNRQTTEPSRDATVEAHPRTPETCAQATGPGIAR